MRIFLILLLAAITAITLGQVPMEQAIRVTETENKIDSLFKESRKNFIDTDFEESYNQLILASHLATAINNKKLVARGLLHLGNFHFYHNADFQLAGDYYRRSLLIARLINDSTIIARSYLNLAKLYSADTSLYLLKKSGKILWTFS